MREDKLNNVDLKDQLKNRHKHHLKFQKGCLNPFGGLNEDKEMDNMNHSLSEAKKKKYHVNTDAGNVEHNINMFNMANTVTEGPSCNPCGPMGESLTESRPDGADIEIPTKIVPNAFEHKGYTIFTDTSEAGVWYVKDSYDNFVGNKSGYSEFAEALTYVDSLHESVQRECELCGHTLTDGGQCPVCDLGDEDARESHTIYAQDIDYDDDMDESYLGEDFEDDGSNEDIDVNCEGCAKLMKAPAGSEGPYYCPDCVPTKNESYSITARAEDGSLKYYNKDTDSWHDSRDEATKYDDLDVAHYDFFEITPRYTNQFRRIFVPVFEG